MEGAGGVGRAASWTAPQERGEGWRGGVRKKQRVCLCTAEYPYLKSQRGKGVLQLLLPVRPSRVRRYNRITLVTAMSGRGILSTMQQLYSL